MNRRPPPCKGGALPAELLPQSAGLMVGLGGFEPPASRLSGVRSNQLSYRPFQRTSGRLLENWIEMANGSTSVRLPSSGNRYSVRKEVIQPQVLLRLPCYDLVPVTSFAVGTAESRRLKALPASMT